MTKLKCPKCSTIFKSDDELDVAYFCPHCELNYTIEAVWNGQLND